VPFISPAKDRRFFWHETYKIPDIGTLTRIDTVKIRYGKNPEGVGNSGQLFYNTDNKLFSVIDGGSLINKN